MQMWNELHDALVEAEVDPPRGTGQVASAARVLGVQPSSGLWLVPDERSADPPASSSCLPWEPLLVESAFAAKIFRAEDTFCIRNDRSVPWWRDASRRTLQLSCTDRVRALQFHHSYQRRVLGTALPEAMARFTWRIESESGP